MDRIWMPADLDSTVVLLNASLFPWVSDVLFLSRRYSPEL
jgi:hypothetical protein